MENLKGASFIINREEIEIYIMRSAGISLSAPRIGFTGTGGEWLIDENCKYTQVGITTYEVNFGANWKIELDVAVAFELSQCLDAFCTEYNTFKRLYKKNVIPFGELSIGNCFSTWSISQEYFFVKKDSKSAFYLDDSKEIIVDTCHYFEYGDRVKNLQKNTNI